MVIKVRDIVIHKPPEGRVGSGNTKFGMVVDILPVNGSMRAIVKFNGRSESINFGHLTLKNSAG